MNEDIYSTTYRVARDGQELGAWTIIEIRQCVAAGSLLTSDLVCADDETWSPMLPVLRRRFGPFDWGGEDDRLFYYIRDGFVHGPRLIEEILAMHSAGYLPGDTSISSLGWEQWLSIEETLRIAGTDEGAEPSTEHFEAAKQQLLNGNIFSAAINFGAHIFKNLPDTPSNNPGNEPPQLKG
jgi:hypothetical protein